jgi:hypothetical protein
MPIYIGSGNVAGPSTAFTISDNSNNILFQQGVGTYSSNTFGYYVNTGVPGFIAGSASDPGWITAGTDSWNKVNNYCTTTVYNRGSYYSTVDTRFTAPVSGPYLFIWTAYCYQTVYFHPVFAVNGSLTARRYNLALRIRGHGMVANYNQDAQIEEVINLTAGDYVEVYHYSGGTSYTYPVYSLFQGVYVG